MRSTLLSIWYNGPLLLLAGVVFSLISFPAGWFLLQGHFVPGFILGLLTIPPAWLALLALIRDVLWDVKTHIVVMLRAFARYWPRGVGFGALLYFPLILGLLTWPLLSTSAPLFVWIAFILDVFVFLILVLIYLYATPLVVLHDMRLIHALRNGFVLIGRYLLNTIGLLSLGVLFLLAMLYLSSGLVFVLPQVWGMFLVNNCRMVVAQERDPSSRERENGTE